MATTVFFEEIIKDQGGKRTMEIEFGRYSSCDFCSGMAHRLLNTAAPDLQSIPRKT